MTTETHLLSIWTRWLGLACLLASAQLTAACDDPKASEAMDTPEACVAPRVLLYTTPGCGPEIKPTCQSGSAGACATVGCNCKGEKIFGPCNGLSEKFKPASECKLDGGF
jgi:hypothetical protein